MLLKTIADLEPHHGTICLDNIHCNSIDAPTWRKQVALLPAESVWWYDQTGDHFKHIDITSMAQLGLDSEIMSKPISYLSTGEKQRLALLRLLQNNPQALLLDEPTASLDPGNVKRFESFIKTHQQQHQTAIIWVSHDPQQIKRVSDQHYLLSGGQLIMAPRL